MEGGGRGRGDGRRKRKASNNFQPYKAGAEAATTFFYLQVRTPTQAHSQGLQHCLLIDALPEGQQFRDILVHRAGLDEELVL